MKYRASALLATACMLCIASSSASRPGSSGTVSVRAASNRIARMMHQPVPLSPIDQRLTWVLGAGLVALQFRRQHKALTASRLSI